MDVLANLLNSLRLTASTFLCQSFSASWGMQIAAGEQGEFHILLHGEAVLGMPGQEPMKLTAGDIVALPRGVEHTLADHLDTPLEDGVTLVGEVLQGKRPELIEGTTKTTLMCGTFSFAFPLGHPLFEALPELIFLRTAKQPQLAWLWSLVQNLAREATNKPPGAEAIVDRLSEVLIIHLLREHWLQQSDSGRFLHALQDPHIGKALTLMHKTPEHAWTLVELAKRVGLSRTSFANRFRQQVGKTPMEYLGNWRIEQAKLQLSTSQAPLSQIAEAAGYGSEAAFSKAFRQRIGLSPGRWRTLQNAALSA